MAHSHSVYDNDKHFSIDPVTREIKNESGKIVLMQHDHNSERFTFEIPKEVEGHDMMQCNVVRVHYINIEAGKDGLIHEDIYDVDDLQTSPNSDDVVIFSWLISGNATQYEGGLHFAIQFACVTDDGTIDYSWSTGTHSSVSIGNTIYNTEVLAVEYADVLEKWRIETFDMVQDTLNDFASTGLADGSVTAEKIAPGAVSTTYAVTIDAEWSGSAAPYSKDVTVNGLLDSDTPIIDLVASSVFADAEAQIEAWGYVYKAVTTENTLTLYAIDKPSAALPVQIKVVRK